MIGRDVPQSQVQFMRDLAVDILARTSWGEARNQGARGMEAVACVVLNRIRIAERKNGYWWGRDVFSVCQKPYQFSCWNRDDPNRQKLLCVTKADPVFAQALAIAERAVNNQLPDITLGATHYHARSVKPFWTKGKTPCAIFGAHIFYKLEGD